MLVSNPALIVRPSSTGIGYVPGSWNTIRTPYPEENLSTYSSISRFNVSFIPEIRFY
jgi:hypothetical protein